MALTFLCFLERLQVKRERRTWCIQRLFFDLSPLTGWAGALLMLIILINIKTALMSIQWLWCPSVPLLSQSSFVEMPQPHWIYKMTLNLVLISNPTHILMTRLPLPHLPASPSQFLSRWDPAGLRATDVTLIHTVYIFIRLYLVVCFLKFCKNCINAWRLFLKS